MSIESRFANSPTISALTDRDARQSAYNILEIGGIIIMEIGDSGPYGLLIDITKPSMLEIVSAKRPLPPTYPSRDEALHSEYVEWETRAKDQLTIVVTDLGDAISCLDFSRIDPSLHDTLKNPTRLAQLLDENNCLLRVPIEDNATIRGIALPATTYSVDPDGKKWVQIFVPGPSNPQTNEFLKNIIKNTQEL